VAATEKDSHSDDGGAPRRGRRPYHLAAIGGRMQPPVAVVMMQQGSIDPIPVTVLLVLTVCAVGTAARSDRGAEGLRG
jgi:hypothetical protein